MSLKFERSLRGLIYSKVPVETGDEVVFIAENIRRERTGIHSKVSIGVNTTYLAWSTFNIERDEERVRLANSAFKDFSEPLRSAYIGSRLKHDFDLFCRGLWDAYMEQFAPEMLAGDPEAPPPTFMLEPFVIEGGGTIVFAPPGRGKSYLALVMAVSIDAGSERLWPVTQSKVLFINLERSRISIRRRIACVNTVLGLLPDRPLLFLNARGRSLSEVMDSARQRMLDEEIGVVFLDSISRAGFGDLTENAPVNRIIDSLNLLAPTWLALAHTPRGDESHVYGSIHFEAGEDIGVQLLSEQLEDGTLGVGLKITKANDIKIPPVSVLAMEFGVLGLSDAYAAKPGQFPEIEASRKIPLWLEIQECLLQVGKATATEIAETLDRNRANVSHLLATTGRFTRAGKEGQKVYWGVKERGNTP